MKFSPGDVGGNTITISRARVVDRVGTVIGLVPLERIKPVEQIERFAIDTVGVSLTTESMGGRAIVALELRPPLILKSHAEASTRTQLRRCIISLLVGLGGGLLANRLPSRVNASLLRHSGNALAWIRQKPGRVLLITAAASVLLSCYPVVFFGRSFLSPNNHSHSLLLYGEMPTLPGYKESATDSDIGADMGAALWYSWPASVIESRALFKDFQLPLWNRYDSAGLPLLGQGQSMFGDPLHLLVLLTRGAAGWWDLKYLLAKFLFAASLGFCVLYLTKHVPASVIVALSASFIGFYSYRYSHPAFFSMSYAPLIFLCWLKLAARPGGRASPSWLGLMVLANWTLMNSGTVKEAYVLLMAMNFCGALTLVFGRDVTNKIRKLCQAIGVLLLFVVIATPVWWTFLQTLRTSWTVYDTGGVFQLQPGLLIGLFDDIFYRQFNAGELHLDPSANFLVLVAVLWFCFAARGADPRRLSWGISTMAVLVLGLVFGVVSPWVILRIPFLNRIYHIDNTFSCVAIIGLLLLAGFGIRSFWDDCRAPHFKRAYVRVLFALVALFALYLGTTQAAQRSTASFLRAGEYIPKSAFFWGYTLLLLAAAALIPGAARLVIARHRFQWQQVFSLGLLFILLHWSHGMHLLTPFDKYVMNPQPRPDLLAESSPALNLIKARSIEPSRSVGLDYNFAPGYGGAVGLEQIDSAAPLLNKHNRSLMDASGIRLLFGGMHEGVIGENLATDLPLLNMLNVRFLLGSGADSAELAPSVTRIALLDLDVYESTAVWPRAFFTNEARSCNSDGEFVSLLKNGDGRPFAAIAPDELQKWPDLSALVHNSPPLPGRQVIAATDYVLRTNTISFKVRAPGPGVVVLTESYVANDFQLHVNDKPADYFRVNSAFRGVVVPAAGDYQISFTYWPQHLTASLWLSALGLTLLAIWMATAWKPAHGRLELRGADTTIP